MTLGKTTGKPKKLAMPPSEEPSVEDQYSRAVQTIVDGAVFFDVGRDQDLRRQGGPERVRLIRKMAEAKAGGASTRRPGERRSQIMERCDDVILYHGLSGN